MTSHAAVVARGMGKPCISGSNEIKIDYENKYLNQATMKLRRRFDYYRRRKRKSYVR
jgi:pyruvate,orthophosphate dikinase